MKFIDDKRVSALTTTDIGKHFALVKTSMTRFKITEGSTVFSMNYSGISFKNTLNRSFCNGVARVGKELFPSGITTRGNLDRKTIMRVVNAVKKQFRPDDVFLGV